MVLFINYANKNCLTDSKKKCQTVSSMAWSLSYFLSSYCPLLELLGWFQEQHLESVAR
jgi:hypothetical protein